MFSCLVVAAMLLSTLVMGAVGAVGGAEEGDGGGGVVPRGDVFELRA